MKSVLEVGSKESSHTTFVFFLIIFFFFFFIIFINLSINIFKASTFAVLIILIAFVSDYTIAFKESTSTVFIILLTFVINHTIMKSSMAAYISLLAFFQNNNPLIFDAIFIEESAFAVFIFFLAFITDAAFPIGSECAD